jgi:hypothetical protein
MINEQLVRIILGELNRIEKEYQFSQGMILSEDDLKCHLFSKLRALLPQAEPTFNPEVFGSCLHAEVKFFDEEELLTIRPDISIIDPRHLSIYHSVEFEVKRGKAKYNNYSSKCFEVGGSAIVVELKFCRDHNGISDAELSAYKDDLEKINRLQKIVCSRSNGHDKIYGIFAVFNKTNIGAEKVASLKTGYDTLPDIHLVYATGNVDFKGVNPNILNSGYLVDQATIC